MQAARERVPKSNAAFTSDRRRPQTKRPSPVWAKVSLTTHPLLAGPGTAVPCWRSCHSGAAWWRRPSYSPLEGTFQSRNARLSHHACHVYVKSVAIT